MQTSYVQILNQRSSKDDVQSLYRKRLPSSSIDFRSAEGKQLFSEALAWGCMECFFKLSSQLRTQDDTSFSGLSSLVMALNAFKIDPGRIWKSPWRWYDESMVAHFHPSKAFQEKEINMSQFICLSKRNGLHPKAVYGKEIISLDHLRRAIVSATQTDDTVLVANYDRQILNQTGEGHFSPIGGYHPGCDMVLILDTARFIYPPHWVELEA